MKKWRIESSFKMSLIMKGIANFVGLLRRLKIIQSYVLALALVQ